MLNIVFLVVFFSMGLWPHLSAAAPDPQINVLNVGNYVLAQPMVSSDRKYITFNGASAGSSSLRGVNKARIVTANILGISEFTATTRAIMRGEWEGDVSNKHASSSSETACSFAIGGGTSAAGFIGKQIHSVTLGKMSSKGKLSATAYYTVEEPTRKTARGHIIVGKKQHQIKLKGIVDQTVQAWTGQWADQDGSNGVFSFHRKEPCLTFLPDGQWIADILIGEELTPQQLCLSLQAGKIIKTTWPLLSDLEGTVLRWNREQNHALLYFTYHLPNDKKTYHFHCNGVLSETGQQFDAWLQSRKLGSGRVRFQLKQ